MRTKERYEFIIVGDSEKRQELVKDIKAIQKPKSPYFDFQELINDDWIRYHLTSTLDRIMKDKIVITVVNYGLEDTRQYVRSIHEKYGLDIYFHGGEIGYYALIKFDPEERFYNDNYVVGTYFPFGSEYGTLKGVKRRLTELGYSTQDIDKAMEEIKTDRRAELSCLVPEDEMSDGDGTVTVHCVCSLTNDEIYKEDVKKEYRLEDYGYGAEYTAKGTLVAYYFSFWKGEEHQKTVMISLFQNNAVQDDVLMEIPIDYNTTYDEIHEKIRNITEF